MLYFLQHTSTELLVRSSPRVLGNFRSDCHGHAGIVGLLQSENFVFSSSESVNLSGDMLSPRQAKLPRSYLVSEMGEVPVAERDPRAHFSLAEQLTMRI